MSSGSRWSWRASMWNTNEMNFYNAKTILLICSFTFDLFCSQDHKITSSHCNSAFWREYTAQLSLNGSCDVTVITWVFFITQISTFKRLFDLKLKSKVETRWTFYFRVLFSAHMNCCCWIKCFFLKIDNTNKKKYPISFRNI